MAAIPYFLWKGIDGDSRLFQGEGTVNLQWQPPNLGQTYSRPALLSLPGTILIAYRGPDDDDGIYWNNWTPNGWTPRQNVAGVGTSWAPALAPWGNGAIMVWNGVGNDTRIWCSTYYAATNKWSPQYLTKLPNGGPIQSSSCPAIANFAFEGILVMVWRGEGDNDSLYYSTSKDGVNWQGNVQISGAASTIAPCMAVTDNILWLAFKGSSDDTGIYGSVFGQTEGGLTWATVNSLGPFGTSHGPSLAVLPNGERIMTWKGVTGDSSIYYSTSSDGSGGFIGQTVISNTGSSVGPAVCVSDVADNTGV